MTKYVALLRGIGPGNPNMHGDALRGFFEQLGFKSVKPIISSGNVIFESPSKKVQELEALIERELPKELGFTSTAIIRSREQLQQIVDKDPFDGKEHSRELYLTVTFLKKAESESEIFNAWDTTSLKNARFMVELEKKFGKNITTRTWKTVARILKAME